ncbi:type I restriction endonuclease subunit R [Holzapfeliella sp. He02]|uniref:Type I restriction enzyme endonuclease subunit n=1 Tax=Holzapfeliella saturejae TaxID=3082953 RepID=A0ABU8SE88_9LACO
MGQYESEAQLENRFIKQLETLGYQYVTIKDNDDLLAHFRKILNERNQTNLKGKPLTDAEFQRVYTELVGTKSHYKISYDLRGSINSPIGKISITRDSGEPLFLNIFDVKNAAANTYEVTNQITMMGRYENRYDVTVLINGMPLLQIELKRRGVEFSQAFNQIIRYRNETFKDSLFRMVQLFVVSNGEDTRYFANGDGNLNSKFMFRWTDKHNKWLNEITEFMESFFPPERLHSILGQYVIFDESHSRMMVMRPYQIYAVEGIINQVENHPDKNGYVWHTTGSGKTITSFKASQLLKQREDVDKVIFLIDRNDLDVQTSKNFNSYLGAKNGDLAIDRTDDTKTLVKQLQQTDEKLVITTIQKMNNAVSKDYYKNLLAPYRDKKVIFIEDEAHRSQFGDMRKNVNNWFKNAQHIGFTGTPIFKENIGSDGRTTQDLYDQELHHYLIKDAIRDQNVLGFNVQYLQTFDAEDIDDNGQADANAIDKKEVMEHPDRLEQIARHIILNHRQYTKNGEFNAILTVPNTRVALAYYDIFKKLQAQNPEGEKLNITSVFTWAANEQDNEKYQDQDDVTSRHGLEHIVADYNQLYGENFSVEDFKDYFNDISIRMKQHHVKTPEQNIDILIVVNMFLTGFDSPKLSTLYVDKKLKYHGLIQAYSRTNRIDNLNKPFGNIVNYRNLKTETDDAIRLFSDGSREAFLAPSYEEMAENFRQAIEKLHDIIKQPKDVDNLYNMGEDHISEFIKAFRDVLRIYNKIRVYDEFKWENFALDLTPQQYESFQSKYREAVEYLEREAKNNKKISIVDDLDFELALIQQDDIDVSYIMGLVQNIDFMSTVDDIVDHTEKIKQQIEQAAQSQLHTKKELLLRFLEEEVPQYAEQANVDVLTEFNQYINQQKEDRFNQLSKEVEVPVDSLKHQLDEYNFRGECDSRSINNDLKGIPFKEKRQRRERIMLAIQDIGDHYKALD